MNLLDLDNDCLNIIGDMVKKENKKTEIIDEAYKKIIEYQDMMEGEIYLEDLFETVCDYLVCIKTDNLQTIFRDNTYLLSELDDDEDVDGSIQIFKEIFDYADEVIEKLRCNGNYLTYNDDRTKLLKEIYKMNIYTIYEIDIEPCKKAIIKQQILEFLNYYEDFLSEYWNWRNVICYPYDDDEEISHYIEIVDIIARTDFDLTDEGYSRGYFRTLYDDIKQLFGLSYKKKTDFPAI